MKLSDSHLASRNGVPDGEMLFQLEINHTGHVRMLRLCYGKVCRWEFLLVPVLVCVLSSDRVLKHGRRRGKGARALHSPQIFGKNKIQKRRKCSKY
jgi:hypothetical protein